MDEQDTKSPRDDKKKKYRHGEKAYVWPIKATLISLVLGLVFAFGAEILLSDTAIIIAVSLIIVLVLLGILFDMMGLAVASCDPVPLRSMASRRVRGAKHALALSRNAHKVSSVFNDIVGDSIGIITGVCGAALAAELASGLTGFARISVAVAVSAVIAALTIGGKAAMKGVAIRHSTRIVLAIGKFMSLFRSERRR
jgi:CBS domain containing-hemolysin-like protein